MEGQGPPVPVNGRPLPRASLLFGRAGRRLPPVVGGGGRERSRSGWSAAGGVRRRATRRRRRVPDRRPSWHRLLSAPVWPRPATSGPRPGRAAPAPCRRRPALLQTVADALDHVLSHVLGIAVGVRPARRRRGRFTVAAGRGGRGRRGRRGEAAGVRRGRQGAAEAVGPDRQAAGAAGLLGRRAAGRRTVPTVARRRRRPSGHDRRGGHVHQLAGVGLERQQDAVRGVIGGVGHFVGPVVLAVLVRLVGGAIELPAASSRPDRSLALPRLHPSGPGPQG